MPSITLPFNGMALKLEIKVTVTLQSSRHSTYGDNLRKVRLSRENIFRNIQSIMRDPLQIYSSLQRHVTVKPTVNKVKHHWFNSSTHWHLLLLSDCETNRIPCHVKAVYSQSSRQWHVEAYI